MEVDLQNLVGTAGDFQSPMLSLLRATLEYEADTSLVGAKLAEDIKFICKAEALKVASRTEGSKKGTEGALFYVWWLVIDIARCIPPDHPWQDRLVQAVEHLRHEEGVAPNSVSGLQLK